MPAPPALESLTDDRLAACEAALSTYEGPLIDYTVANLATLQIRGRMFLHREGGVTFIVRSGAGRFDLALPPLPAAGPETFERALDLLERLNGDPGGRILNVDAALPGRLGLDPDAVEAIPDRPDYIYDAADLSRLDGPAYRMRRKDVNRFLKNFPDAATEPLAQANAREAARLLPLLFPPRPPDAGRRPSPHRFDMTAPGTTRYWDRYATIRLLHGIGTLPARGVLLRVFGRPAGFVIGARRGATLGVLVGKIVEGFEAGLTLLLQRLVAGWPEPLSLVNLADDAGERGLRRMKENLRPVFLAGRVTLRRRGRPRP